MSTCTIGRPSSSRPGWMASRSPTTNTTSSLSLIRLAATLRAASRLTASRLGMKVSR